MTDGDDPLARIVHDLRSPLAVVDGFAGLLAREDLEPAKRIDYARRIADAAAEMRAVLDDAQAARAAGTSSRGPK
jgi:signal transduction histidine kinase